MISENVSSSDILFANQIGTVKYIKTLNEIASSYETNGITIGSRHTGYNGQTEEYTYNTDMPNNCQDGTTSPIQRSDSCNVANGSAEEKRGCGDCGYLDDYLLIEDVLGTRVATDISGEAKEWALASRLWNHNDRGLYSIRYITTTGALSDYSGSLIYYGGVEDYVQNGKRIRPILKLDASKLKPTGTGIENDPWKLN